MTAVRKEWKKRRPFGRWVILAVMAVGLTVALTSATGASLPGSTFEIDTDAAGANLIVDVPGNLDWANVAQTQATDITPAADDDSYQGGTKEDTVCPGTTTGSIPPNKSDLLNFGGYFEPEANGPGYLHVFWRRVQEPSGTTNMDFEFNKSATDCDGDGPSKNVTRTVGDILLQFDIDQGGAQAQLSRRTWTGTEWSDPPVDLDATGGAIGSINQQPILDANSDGLGAMSVRTFGEASFDLATVLDPTKCDSFGSAMLKSRSSDSFTSQLKDFIAPIPVDIRNCGKVIIRKVTDPAGSETNFNYTKAFATDPVSDNTFQLNGAAGTNVKTFDGVLFGAGSVEETLPLPAGWEFVGLDCSASSGVTPLVSGRTASWTIDDPADVVDCTYTNRLRQGAILITKTRKHAAAGGSAPHAGVSFTVNGTTKVTDANGQACFDGLLWADGGTSYSVTETLPAGYHAEGDLVKNVLVDNNAACADSPYGGETVSFVNIPLTNLSVSVDSQVDGGTASTIDCDDNLSDLPVATGANGDGSKNIVDLEPGTYTCTIVIDP